MREDVATQEALRVEHLVAAVARELVVTRVDVILQRGRRRVATAALLALVLAAANRDTMRGKYFKSEENNF